MNNNRNVRVQSAEQTLQILKNKYYQIQNRKISVSEQIDHSVNHSILYTSEDLDDLIQEAGKRITTEDRETIISIENCTSMQAFKRFSSDEKTGCLNFASAMNPGGGFLSGAQAQEESLSRASSLYLSQMRYFDEMYNYNRHRKTYLYSDRMIYSPAVCFFKDDDNNLLSEPYYMDVLTSPAVNISAMLQNKRPDELEKTRETMLKRIDKLLAAFYVNGARNLILGAWGCGVFGNKPRDVANYFAHFLTGDGKYSKCFGHIIFAIYCNGKNRDNIEDFVNVFE